MNAIPFDTLQFTNRLKAVGFTGEQAAAITEIQREASIATLQVIRDYRLAGATKRGSNEIQTGGNHDH